MENNHHEGKRMPDLKKAGVMSDEDLSKNVCFCFHVSYRKVLNFLKREKPKVGSQISNCFNAGGGCGWCIPHLLHMHQQVVIHNQKEIQATGLAQYEEQRKQYLADIRAGKRSKNKVINESAIDSKSQKSTAQNRNTQASDQSDTSPLDNFGADLHEGDYG